MMKKCKVNIRQYLNFNYGNHTIRKQAVKILTLLSPVYAIMQEKSWNVALATELITNATSEISLMRSEENFEVIASEAGLTKADRVQPKRERLQSKLLAGCLMNTTLGIRGNDTSTSHWDQERQAYFGVIDAFTG